MFALCRLSVHLMYRHSISRYDLVRVYVTGIAKIPDGDTKHSPH
jgi:hypothetical protein